MKKFLSLIFALLIMLSFSVLTYAKEYNFDKFDVSFSFPDDWYVITRDSKESDVFFSFGADYKETMKFLSENDVYAYLLPNTLSNEVLITIVKNNSLESLNGFSEQEMKSLASETAKSFTSQGFSNISYSVYSSNNLKFIVLDYQYLASDYAIYFTQYSTVVNNYTINITLNSVNLAINSENKTIVKNIADSLKDNTPKTQETLMTNTSTSSGNNSDSLFSKVFIAGIVGAFFGAFQWLKSKMFGEEKPKKTKSTKENPPVIAETKTDKAQENTKPEVKVQYDKSVNENIDKINNYFNKG